MQHTLSYAGQFEQVTHVGHSSQSGGAPSHHRRASSGWGRVARWRHWLHAMAAVMSVWASGRAHAQAPRVDVLSWGKQQWDQGDLRERYSMVAAGHLLTVALRNNGTVVAWGTTAYGQTNVPDNLIGVKQVAAGYLHTVALKNDGTLVAWGSNYLGQTTVPDNLIGVKQVSAGGYHTVALKNNGTVVAWGSNANGRTDVPANTTGVTQVAAG